MIIRKAQGIILRRDFMGENDLRITFLTPSLGKIFVTAKGAKKVGSRRGPHLDLMNLCDATLEEVKGGTYLRTIRALQTFPSLKENLFKFHVACFILAMADEIVPRGLPDRSPYKLILENLSLLQKLDESSVSSTLFFFCIKLLHAGGLLPGIRQCNRCHTKLSEGAFLSLEGSIVCSRCTRLPHLSLSEEAVSSLEHARTLPSSEKLLSLPREARLFLSFFLQKSLPHFTLKTRRTFGTFFNPLSTRSS